MRRGLSGLRNGRWGSAGAVLSIDRAPQGFPRRGPSDLRGNSAICRVRAGRIPGEALQEWCEGETALSHRPLEDTMERPLLFRGKAGKHVNARHEAQTLFLHSHS
jgi:hypothetical protein